MWQKLGVGCPHAVENIRQLAAKLYARILSAQVANATCSPCTYQSKLIFLDNLFNDTDPKVGQTAVALAGNYAIKEAVDPLLRIIQDHDYLGARRPLRVKVISALGEIGDPRALAAMQKFFTFSFLPWPPREERYAAWQSLAGYPPEARKPLVESGLKSSDGHVREICSRMRNS